MTRAVLSGNGTVYFSSGDGLYAYDPRANMYDIFIFPEWLPTVLYKPVTADDKGNLWLSVGFQQEPRNKI
jgi:outer membrane protein assembly factor BamB